MGALLTAGGEGEAWQHRAAGPLVAGNWKMNGLKASAAELGKIMQGAGDLWTKVDLMICPPATLIMTFALAALGSKVAIGGQDCHAEPSGAFTGDISAEMLADLGASAVIVGHSERRTLHKETDAEVLAKAKAAWRAGLMAIVCIGETRAEREAGQTLDVLGRQLARLAAGRRDRGEPGGRLRAGLGDRHRPDADRRRRGAGARVHPHPAGRAPRRGRGRRCASSMAARSSHPTPRN